MAQYLLSSVHSILSNGNILGIALLLLTVFSEEVFQRFDTVAPYAYLGFVNSNKRSYIIGENTSLGI
jgi:hypothetical protein